MSEPHLLADRRLRSVLLALNESATPVGARTLVRHLNESGIAISESTVNRLLTRLDDLGLTYSAGGKGRGLSAAGRGMAERLVLLDVHVAGLDALEIKSLTNLREVLIARRGLEREIVRAVAVAATDTEIAMLEGVLNGRTWNPPLGRDTAPGNRFHRILPTLTRNRSLQALGAMLLDDNAHEHERLLDVVTASSGGKSTSKIEHHSILDAIKKRDFEAAEREMVRHLDRLIDATEQPLSQLAWQAFTMPGDE